MTSIRNIIFASKPEFKFPIFDLAISRYEEILGKDVTRKNEKKEFLLDRILETASIIPAIGSIKKLYDELKKGGKFLNDVLEKIQENSIKDKIKRVMECKSIDDIENRIVNFFVYDLSDTERDFSIVFLIDTLELLNYDDGKIKTKIANSIKNVLPNHVKNSLWVLAGRNKIYDSYDNQHLIGDLSEHDTYVYLKEKQGISDDEINKKIYEMTGGTPIYLDICVTNYRNAGYPKAKDFEVLDKTELIKRYLKYLEKDKEREIIRAMSSFMHWIYEDFKTVFTKVHNTSWSLYEEAYRTITKTTMIEKLDKERWFLHRTVRNAIYDDETYKELEYRETTFNEILDIYKTRTEDPGSNQIYYRDRIIELLERTLELNEDLTDEQISILTKIINNSRKIIVRHGIVSLEPYQKLLNKLETSKYNKNYYFTELLRHLYFVYGDYNKALQLDQEVLDKRKTILGEDHPDTLSSMNNLAITYRKLCKYEEALKLHQKASEKIRTILGEDHPDTLSLMNHLAITYDNFGKYAEAMKLYQEVLEKRKIILGEDHPSTLSSMNNLSITYDNLGKYEEALKLKQEVLEKRKIILGEDHPSTLSSMNNLANTYDNLGRYEEALKLYQEVFEKRTTILGEDHPKTLSSMNNLACIYNVLGKYEEALKNFTILLEKYSKLYGEDYKETIEIKRIIEEIKNKIDK